MSFCKTEYIYISATDISEAMRNDMLFADEMWCELADEMLPGGSLTDDLQDIVDEMHPNRREELRAMAQKLIDACDNAPEEDAD